jgi:hypothetical protein
LPRDLRPTLTAAVGLWEGPSQLRRIALLLNDRLTLLRHCPRRWRFAATAISLTAAICLSLVTLQPKSRAEQQLVPSNSAPNVAANAKPEPNTLVGQIVDENQGPLANVNVRIYTTKPKIRGREEVAANQTDKDGHFRFDLADQIKTLFADGRLPERDEQLLEQPEFLIEARLAGRVS